eukprot:TRINITY_DN41570_c0_g1_i1.p1 TRINITY_DN41570_c0_g1~~TRINITY_DN41570_c0_g1_i1.p1  ORF type:complete len:597 (-),score=168.47 TRINITY_DN41570_c0_g1_i1:243-2033(-)
MAAHMKMLQRAALQTQITRRSFLSAAVRGWPEQVPSCVRSLSSTSEGAAKTYYGRVKRWNEDRGFGFIVPDDGGDDIFVHRSHLNESAQPLVVGKVVSYTTAWNSRKETYWAVDVDAASSDEADAASRRVDEEAEAAAAEVEAAEPEPMLESLKMKTLEMQQSLLAQQQDMQPAATMAAGATAAAATTVAAAAVATQASRLAATAGKGSKDGAEAASKQPASSVAAAAAAPAQETSSAASSSSSAVAAVDKASAPSSSLAATTPSTAAAVADGVDVMQPPSPMQVERLEMPKGASVEQKLDLMAAQMEQLRLQGAQNQQLLFQGLYAMMQQQTAQNANIERALATIADSLGGDAAAKILPPSRPSIAPSLVQAEATPSSSSTAKPSPSPEGKATMAQPAASRVAPDSSAAKETSPEKKTDAAVDAAEGSRQAGQQAVSQADTKAAESSDDSDEEPELTDVQKRREQKNQNYWKRMQMKLWDADSFHMVGSFTDWSIEERAMPENGARITIRRDAPRAGSGNVRREEFQIVGDKTWEKRIFPAGGEQEDTVVLKLDQPSAANLFDPKKGAGHGRNWAVEGVPGTSFRLKYDGALPRL